MGVRDGKKIVLKRHFKTLNSKETITGIRQLLQLGFKPPTLASFDAALAKGQLDDRSQLQAYLTSVIEELDRHCLLFRFLEVVDPSQPLPADTKLINDPIKDYFSVSYTYPENYVPE